MNRRSDSRRMSRSSFAVTAVIADNDRHRSRLPRPWARRFVADGAQQFNIHVRQLAPFARREVAQRRICGTIDMFEKQSAAHIPPGCKRPKGARRGSEGRFQPDRAARDRRRLKPTYAAAATTPTAPIVSVAGSGTEANPTMN
jgi:hypothetical protein